MKMETKPLKKKTLQEIEGLSEEELSALEAELLAACALEDPADFEDQLLGCVPTEDLAVARFDNVHRATLEGQWRRSQPKAPDWQAIVLPHLSLILFFVVAVASLTMFVARQDYLTGSALVSAGAMVGSLLWVGGDADQRKLVRVQA